MKRLIGLVISGIIALGVFVAILTAIFIKTQSDTTQPPKAAQTASQVVQPKPISTSDINLADLDYLVNDFRDQAKFPAYHTWAPLISAAQTKCNDMVARNYWSHTTPDGQTFDVNDNKYVQGEGVTRVGENIAEGYDNAPDVFNAWVKSKEHLANIIDPDFTDSGLAICKSDNFQGAGPALLVVEEFAAR